MDVAQVKFMTNYGEIVFNVWDTAGQEKYGGLQDGYFIGANCAILMFDVTNSQSYQHVLDWHQKVTNVAGNIPMVICGSKVDLNSQRTVQPEDIDMHRALGTPYYDVSAKSNYNFEKPFLDLARKLTGYPDLAFN